MATPTTSTPQLRQLVRPLTARIGETGHRQATWLELFFDLCFVVAVAALARALLADPTWTGALIYVGLFVPVWWAWMGYAWFGNTFDNDDLLYRVVTFGAMLAAIWMAAGVESAATGDGTAFAIAYIVLRCLLLGLQFRALRDVGSHPEVSAQDHVRGFLTRYIAWGVVGLIPWVASLAFDGAVQYVLWGIGLVIELYAPYAANRLRGGVGEFVQLFHLDHIRERYGLFTIIVLGESVLAVSVGVNRVGWEAAPMLVASFAFVVAASIWWMYFDRSGRDALTKRLALAFTWGYAHLVIFAGIAAAGVGAELLIEVAAEGPVEHAASEGEAVATGEGALPGSAIVAGGVVAFLVGMTIVNMSNLGFRITWAGRFILPLRAGAVVLIVALAAATDIGAVPFMALIAAVMVSLNAIETGLVMKLQRMRARQTADGGHLG